MVSLKICMQDLPRTDKILHINVLKDTVIPTKEQINKLMSVSVAALK